MYMTVYHAQYTYTCTRAHPQRTSSRGQVGELNGPRAPRQADYRARRDTPRRLPCEDPGAEVGEEVRVAVGVGPVEFKLNTARRNRACRTRMSRGCYEETGPVEFRLIWGECGNFKRTAGSRTRTSRANCHLQSASFCGYRARRTGRRRPRAIK